MHRRKNYRDLSRKRRFGLKIARSINNMQDNPVNLDVPNRNHWYNGAFSRLSNISGTKKFLLCSGVLLIALLIGGEYYEDESMNKLDPPLPKNEEVEAKYVPSKSKKLSIKVTLPKSQTEKFERLEHKKSHYNKIKGRRLKLTDVYKARMRKCRRLIYKDGEKEALYNHEYLNDYKIANKDVKSDKSLAHRYGAKGNIAQDKLNYYHQKAVNLWHYRHKIRRIYHRRLAKLDKSEGIAYKLDQKEHKEDIIKQAQKKRTDSINHAKHIREHAVELQAKIRKKTLLNQERIRKRALNTQEQLHKRELKVRQSVRKSPLANPNEQNR